MRQFDLLDLLYLWLLLVGALTTFAAIVWLFYWLLGHITWL